MNEENLTEIIIPESFYNWVICLSTLIHTEYTYIDALGNH